MQASRAHPAQPSRRGLLALGVAGLGAAGLAVGCTRGPADAAGPRSLTGSAVLATGSAQGVYHAWGQALAIHLRARYPQLTVRVLNTTGSVQNLTLIDRRQVTMGLATADAVVEAVLGNAPFERPVPAVALARLYDDYVHLIVRADSGLRRLADLAGRRVAIGSPGSGTALIAGRVLAAARLARVETEGLGLEPGLTRLESGDVAAVFWSGGLGTPAVVDTVGRVQLRLLPLDGVAAAMRTAHGSAYRPAAVPAGTYGLGNPVPTIAAANLLVAHAEIPDSVVTATLATAFDRRDEVARVVPAANALDRRAAISTQPIPLHPAAESYYRDAKP